MGIFARFPTRTSFQKLHKSLKTSPKSSALNKGYFTPFSQSFHQVENKVNSNAECYLSWLSESLKIIIYLLLKLNKEEYKCS